MLWRGTCQTVHPPDWNAGNSCRPGTGQAMSHLPVPSGPLLSDTLHRHLSWCHHLEHQQSTVLPDNLTYSVLIKQHTQQCSIIQYAAWSVQETHKTHKKGVGGFKALKQGFSAAQINLHECAYTYIHTAMNYPESTHFLFWASKESLHIIAKLLQPQHRVSSWVLKHSRHTSVKHHCCCCQVWPAKTGIGKKQQRILKVNTKHTVARQWSSAVNSILAT